MQGLYCLCPTAKFQYFIMALNNNPFIFNNVIHEYPVESKYYTPTDFNKTFQDEEEDVELLHINARSLNRNFDDFQNLLSS